MRKKFSVYNSFSNQAFCGNPAGVVPEADDLTTDQMQNIARQLNLVETVFILKPDNKENFCKLRYFMPERELPITGHPTVAAWSYMRDKGILPKVHMDFLQETAAGIIEIKIQTDKVYCSQKSPNFREINEHLEGEICDILSLTPSDVDRKNPFAVVDTGLGHLIFGLKSLESLMKIKFMPENLKSLCDKIGAREAQIFCLETYQNGYDAHTRNLCPRYGVEDPACGNGNAALGSYFFNFFDKDCAQKTYYFEQGHITKSPSLIEVVTQRSADGVNVMIGGHAFPMMDGDMVV
jgi:trans-2,3-dihydro-3-hydroxyanthranilate isomerase